MRTVLGILPSANEAPQVVEIALVALELVVELPPFAAARKAADWVAKACPQSLQYVPEGTLANAFPAGVTLPDTSDTISLMVMLEPLAVCMLPRMEGTQKVELAVYWVHNMSLAPL